VQRAHAVNTVIFDKTGTLTSGALFTLGFFLREFGGIDGLQGAPTVTDVVVLPAASPDLKLDTEALLALVAAAEASSEHPVAKAIVQHAAAHGCSLLAADSVEVGRAAQAGSSRSLLL
jgi:cation transport ATPase